MDPEDNPPTSTSPTSGGPFWEKVAIVGVGLLGGSIGLRLRQHGLAAQVLGIGRQQDRLVAAQRLGVIDEYSLSLNAAADSDLAVICTPVETIVPLVRELAAHCQRPMIVTDVGSTKAPIANPLASGLPDHVTFIGSHPMAGGEQTGAEAAKADLFVGRQVVLTPVAQQPADTDHETQPLQHLRQFWQALGARVHLMSPEEHDEAVAHISHLPHAISSCLAAATPDEHLSLAATGWRDTTRIAAGDVELWRQIFAQNRAHALQALDKFAKVLSSFREALARNDESQLEHLLTAGKKQT